MTIKDIARLAGCGVATVSRVLNHHPDVSPETRKKVLRVVEQCGFQPNNNAKHLKQQAGTTVAVLVKGAHNLLFAELVERVQALLRDSGQDTAVYYLDEDANEVSYAVQLCRERKPVGILFLGGNLDLFRTCFRQVPVPCVLLTNYAQELSFTNLSSLSMDDEDAAFQAVSFLIGQGHRSIGILSGSPNSSQISSWRLQGCKRAFHTAGLTFSLEEQCVFCRYSMADAYTATQQLLERRPDLTAIFAMSDVMAIGCIRALRDLGRQIPENISVVGCDGISIARYSVPRLTTICQDTGRIAERGVEILLQRIHAPVPSVHEVIPFQILEGESTAPPLHIDREV